MMISLNVHLTAPPDRVWATLADLGSYPEWMADAEAIHFLGEQRRGVGTMMRVPTRVGPLRTTDLMVVVEWEEGRSLGVEHVGTMSGWGRFRVFPQGEGSRLVWTEQLLFPWWLGGGLGAWLARPVLVALWRANLARLAEDVVSGPRTPPAASR